MAKGHSINLPSTTGGQHSFAQIPRADIQRSTFNRSCGRKTTFDAGDLIPIFIDEALPGDTMNLKMSLFARIATLLFPIMDNIYMDVFFFAVPNRLVWDNWEKFNGAQDNPGDDTNFIVPIMNTGTGHIQGTLSDHIGIPTFVADLDHMSLYHRGYNLIWNEWFRDENLQDSVVVDKDDGPDDPADYTLLKRGKRHDYFTSCLPWPQKGDSVELPLGSTAPITIVGDGIPKFDLAGSTDRSLQSSTTSVGTIWSGSAHGSIVDAEWNDPKLEADLSSATASTINELRRAFQIQKLYERDARGGTRYIEVLQSHFGVTSPDARLQRPEYLGGGQTPIMLTPAPSTNGGDGGNLGELGAYGIATSTGIGFNKSFVEHSLIIGMVSARADLNYQQGLDRIFSRSTRWDYYWPALAHIGEQAVLNKEIYAVGGDTTDDLVFGYQERFAEYRYKPSTISGTLKSTSYPTKLDSWHLAQDFDALPVLNDAFIQENPPMERIVTVTGEPDFIFDSFFEYRCARPMPTFSVPGLIDHF